MNAYLDTFLTFSRIGVMTFGGGYAMLPMLQREVVEKKKWAEEAELMDYYAVAQCTPGVIAVNTATFVGTKQKGVLGGIVATLGVIFPSLVIITIIAAFINHFAEYEVVQNALAGIRIAVCALVVVSIYKLARKSMVDAATVIIGAVTFASVAFFGVNPIFMVLLAGAAGFLIKLIQSKVKKEGGKK